MLSLHPLPFHRLLTVIKAPARVFMGLQARLGPTHPVLPSARYQLPWGWWRLSCSLRLGAERCGPCVWVTPAACCCC